MVLADTSVWISHFRKTETSLVELLEEASILMHPFVMGELACGNLKNRALILDSMAVLPGAMLASHREAMHVIDDHRLWGCGIGWVDAHLIAAALLSRCSLWTLDARLDQAAARAGVKPYRPA